jgi:hypothetical protein
MLCQGEISLLGSVGRGTQSIGAKSNSSEEGDERNLMKDLRIQRIFRLAKQEIFKGKAV